MTTAAVYQYINDAGVIVPDTDDLLTEVRQEYMDTLAPDLNTDGSTPQGVLINAEALARAAVVANNAAVANQINPNIAGGVFLEAICALTGFDVPTGTFSTISGVALGGLASTIIPAGQLVSVGEGGPQFASVALVTLDGSGNATVDFQAVDTGPIPAVVDSLVLVAPVLGLETVANANIAVLGVAALSDAAIRALRQNTLALQGVSIAEAITSALFDVPGVTSLSFRENIADTTQTIDGIVLVAHSIWACVAGGSDNDVAFALLGTKTLGANWNGATDVTVVEPASGQTYTVQFDRPTETPMFIELTVTAPGSLSDPQTAVANAALAYADGQVLGQPGFAVGAAASPFAIAAGVCVQLPGVLVTLCRVSLDGASWQTTEITAALDVQYQSTFPTVTVILNA